MFLFLSLILVQQTNVYVGKRVRVGRGYLSQLPNNTSWRYVRRSGRCNRLAGTNTRRSLFSR